MDHLQRGGGGRYVATTLCNPPELYIDAWCRSSSGVPTRRCSHASRPLWFSLLLKLCGLSYPVMVYIGQPPMYGLSLAYLACPLYTLPDAEVAHYPDQQQGACQLPPDAAHVLHSVCDLQHPPSTHTHTHIYMNQTWPILWRKPFIWLTYIYLL